LQNNTHFVLLLGLHFLNFLLACLNGIEQLLNRLVLGINWSTTRLPHGSQKWVIERQRQEELEVGLQNDNENQFKRIEPANSPLPLQVSF